MSSPGNEKSDLQSHPLAQLSDGMNERSWRGPGEVYGEDKELLLSVKDF
jgi:hypothetical protein